MTYEVEMTRDEGGWWTASVRGMGGCHTQGRSIGQALRRSREALAVCGIEASLSDLEPVVHLPADVRRLVESYESQRGRLERQQDATRLSAAVAIERLTGELGVSLRDAAEILGLSHQRVHQVARLGGA